MSCTYVIDKSNRLVLTSVSGVLTADQAFTHQNRLAKDPEFSADMRQLIDCSQLTQIQMDTAEIRAIAQRNFFSPKARRALLVNTTYAFGVGRMLLTFRELAGGEEAMQIFRDREQAMLWLSQG